MSYEIIYKLFTVKKQDKLIPFVVIGSNNCYEHTGRRERNLHKAHFFFKDNQKEFNNIEDIKKQFHTELINTEMENGNIQGRFKSSNSIIKALINKVIDYKDLELSPELYNLYYFKATDKEKEQIKKLYEEENINELLTIEQEEQHKNNIINKLNEDLRKRFIDYLNNIYVYHYQVYEYRINSALDKFKVKKETKQYTEQDIKESLDSDMAYKVEYPKEWDNELQNQFNENFKKEVLNRFKGKTVFCLTSNGGMCKGRIREYEGKVILMKPKSRKYFNSLSEGGSSFMKVDSIIEVNKVIVKEREDKILSVVE